MRVDPFYVQRLSGALNDAIGNEAQLTQELSSGLSVTTLSSNPVAVGQSTILGGEIAADDSYVSAAASAQSKLQVTDSTLGEVVTVLTRAISLTLSGGDGTLTAALGTVSTQRSFLDTSLAQVQSTISYAQSDSALQTAAESVLISSNTAAVATGLSSAETQAQALDNVIATLAKGSLFDYVK